MVFITKCDFIILMSYRQQDRVNITRSYLNSVDNSTMKSGLMPTVGKPRRRLRPAHHPPEQAQLYGSPFP